MTHGGHYRYGISAGASSLLGREDGGVDLVKTHSTRMYSISVARQTCKADSNRWDELYGYPTMEVGALLADYSDIRLSRAKESASPYSGMGYEIGVYGAFRRDFYKQGRFSMGYSLENGIGLSTRPYNKDTNVDNEFIGSPLTIFVGLNLYANYRMSHHWGIGMSMDFKHFSSGALDRPNKGANNVGISANLHYYPYSGRDVIPGVDDASRPLHFERRHFKPYTYLELSASIGGKALLDEWIYYYHYADPSDPNYKTSHYKIRPVWGITAAPMLRYSERWASGIGLDYYMVSYADRIAEVEALRGISGYEHKSSVIGISLQHEAYYKHISAHMSLGYYLYRKMGYIAEQDEKPYYETVGVRYYPKFLPNTFIGYNVKAHLTKADCMELRIGWQWK